MRAMILFVFQDFASNNYFASPQGMSSVCRVRESVDGKRVASSIRNYVSQMKSMTQMMNFMQSLHGNGDRVEFPNLKSNAKSVELRNEGNEEFSSSNFDDALTTYTKSLAHAEEGSAEQMLALGNRSAVLFHLRRYAPCLFDINRVLERNCSEDLKKKLLDRKERCLALIGDGSLAADATDPIKVPDAEEDAEWRNLCVFDNPLIPNASSKIRIECNERWGRHLVAAEDIEAGMSLRNISERNQLFMHSRIMAHVLRCF